MGKNPEEHVNAHIICEPNLTGSVSLMEGEIGFS
jgi:hypothetical protein